MLCSLSLRCLARSEGCQKWLFSTVNGPQKNQLIDRKWVLENTRRRFHRNKKEEIVQKGRSRLAPAEDLSTATLSSQRLIKPFCFTVMVGGGSFLAASIWQYETVQNQMQHLLKRTEGLSDNQIASPLKNWSFRRKANKWWNQLTDGQRVVLGIAGLNCIVFAMWRIPALKPAMVRYFCANPGGVATCWPMLLSTFSHYSAWHLAANMYVLYTFSTGIVSILGKEQFVAFYLTAGTVSSFASYVHKVVMGLPSLSLGASGSIMGVLALVCVQFPNAQLAIILMPWLTFSASSALKAILLMDTTGLLLRWRFFDHAAHLGGALFGISYLKWGQDLIWRQREPIVRWWHDLRNTKT